MAPATVARGTAKGARDARRAAHQAHDPALAEDTPAAGEAPPVRRRGPSPGSRAEREAVRRYLEHLEGGRPDVSREQMQRKLAGVEAALASSTGVRRLELVQRRIDLTRQLDSDPRVLQREFVASAAAYSRRHGITWEAYRQMGVPAKVLDAARVPHHGQLRDGR